MIPNMAQASNTDREFINIIKFRSYNTKMGFNKLDTTYPRILFIAAIICHNDDLSSSLNWLEIVYNSVSSDKVLL